MEDDDYAVYRRMWGFPNDCDQYHKCTIVHSPFYITKSFGSGWIFPKNCPYFPIFKRYINLFHEKGIIQKIRVMFDPKGGLPNQICPTYDGEAIGVKKSFSLFGIVLSGVVLSIFVLV